MANIYNKLTTITDGACILTMSHRYDRHAHIKSELKKIGKPDTNDFWLQWAYATSFPYNDIIVKAINESNKGKFTKPNEYDCTRNHYSIIKTCYDLGYKSVLIMEDDIMFYNNEDYIIKSLNNIPEDYDILMFGGFTADPNVDIILKSEDYWYKNTSIGIWNCSMYMLSRKGMAYYINFMNQYLWVADGPLYMAPQNHNIVNIYISTKPIVIQCDKNIMESDIRDKNTDSINYNTMNLYEKYVNREDY